MPEKRILIIAGPNGAGKTTFALEFLPQVHCPIFVNADEIAASLSPGNPEAAAIAAGRMMLQRLDELVSAGETFAFETTLAGLSYAHKIPEWQARGYLAELIFLTLPTVEMAIERVKTRVSWGGHRIPEEVIRRRFHAGTTNFEGTYRLIVDAWSVYDNGGRDAILIESGPEHGKRHT